MFNDVVILAGGSGTRLWPASSSRLPKQFLPADEKHSFFSMAVERALAVSNERVIVISGKAHIPHIIKACQKFSAAEKKRIFVIGEPAAKNTAPAIACAVSLSLFKNRDNTLLVLTSDHIIKPLQKFKTDASLAAAAAGDGFFTVFGIPPRSADTGFGYIETNKPLNDKKGLFMVTAFHEKPDAQTAKKYTANKNFFWNSGMFAFNAAFMAEQFRLNAPGVFMPFEKLKAPKSSDFKSNKGIYVLNSWQGLDNAYKKAEKISFDYAIAEKCTRNDASGAKTAMVKTRFDWIDIGNWEEYAKINKKSNSIVFEVPADGASCYVDSDIPVALAGVEDLIVVIRSGKDGKPATALITKKGQTQKVRDIVDVIKKSGKMELL